MNQAEATELKKLIDSFVVEEGEPTPVVEVIDGEVEKPKVELTEEELNKLFRRSIPEGFKLADADAVRGQTTGDKVFLRFNGEKRWVPDLETLEKLGFNLADVKNLTDEEVKELKEGFGLFSAKLW